MKNLLAGLFLLLTLGCSENPNNSKTDNDTTPDANTDGNTDKDSGGDSDTGSGIDSAGNSDTDSGTNTDTDKEVTLTIEEQSAGFCLVDGVIESTNTGFTGIGYANTDNDIDKGIEWQVNSPKGGEATIEWRYASEGDRAADLSINDFNIDNIDFLDTGSWTTWATENTTVTLTAGTNTIRLTASTFSGCSNIDVITISGRGISTGNCEENSDTDSDTDTPIDTEPGEIPQYITYLMAGSSDHNSDLNVGKASGVKHYYVTNFDDTTDYLTWTMNLDTGEDYHVWALLNTEDSVPVTLTVDGTGNSIKTSTENIGWQKLNMGTITIPSGQTSITFVRNSNSPNMEIKSLELIKEGDLSAYNQRVANYKADTTWLSEATFGVMFQFGAWGFPKSGDAKSLDDGAADFDVETFAKMIQSTGANYIIWSLTWQRFLIQAPIQAVDDIMGDSSLTSKRDLVGEVAQAMHDRGIRVMLYYHQGMQEEPAWKTKQDFPSEFDDTGSGDRTTFFNNWKAVISDIGARYGDNVDGFFFDDGAVYYPANFEELAAAARTGNPNRLIAYNNVNAVRYTDFSDMTLGERRLSEASYYGTAPEGGDGIFTAGPMEGLFQHSMIPVDYWGIYEANQTVSTSIGVSKAVNAILSAKARNVAISFCMAMWEDGTVTESSLEVLQAVGTALK